MYVTRRLLLATILGLISLPPLPAAADVTTVSYDSFRTAWDRDEPGLNPAAVTASDFGRQFATQLDGQIYAQPIVVRGTLIVATENNKVYGLDPAGGAVRWTRDLGPAWPAAAIGCSDLTPGIGVTSTPVYDPATGSLFFTSKVAGGADVQHPHYYMHAVDPATGAERPGWPVTIQGAPANNPSVEFDAFRHLQRPGLLLLDGVVYAGFGSHCDFGPYRGYVVGVSAAAARITSMWATESGQGSWGGGIWHAGGGLTSDGPGRIFVATGNGLTPPAGPGSPPPATLSQSVVRLKVNADQSLTADDFFAPHDAPELDLNDTDLGSGGPVALPPSFGTPSHPKLLVQQGKDGRIFLLDRDHLGGLAQGPGGGDDVVGVVGPYQGQWGHPAVWGGDGGYLGVPAVFAGLVTYPNSGTDSYNFAAVGTSATMGLTFLRTETAVPALRSGTHNVRVTITTASHLVVRIDGDDVLDVPVTLPPKVLVAFTGSVGGVTGTHAVTAPQITYKG